ncbi:hypothetical protein KPSA3_06634 [Pseudomonas syringae pv. actinidiae]|uniref:Uncharacterized protein n=1 Tax=Pseudomonas syringae pv. actinidiae TaxID=103796 RepID=A0AAN4QE38_PSESF|nr:hypothetical protein KPSA3_06634 [Pseudomonas syringae pv. actinidiae]
MQSQKLRIPFRYFITQLGKANRFELSQFFLCHTVRKCAILFRFTFDDSI